MKRNAHLQTPSLSVVLVAGSGAASIARTVLQLRQQTVRSDIELIVVVAAADDLRSMNLGESEFFAVKVLAVGAIAERGDAAARGIKVATSAVIGLIEDHSFPEPGWAEALIHAHKGPWTGVGPSVENANPDTGCSCLNFLLSYVAFSGEQTGGPRDRIPWHNSAYKSESLIPFHDRLGHLLTWEGDLQDELRAGGHTFYFEPAARTHHANVSRFGSTIRQNLHRGRVMGALRMNREQWPRWRRLIYAAAFPLYPFAHLRYLVPLIRQQRYPLAMRVRIAMLLAPVLWLAAVGEAWGVLTGPGNATQELDNFDLHRLRHVTEKERREIIEFGDTMKPPVDHRRRSA